MMLLVEWQLQYDDLFELFYIELLFYRYNYIHPVFQNKPLYFLLNANL